MNMQCVVRVGVGVFERLDCKVDASRVVKLKGYLEKEITYYPTTGNGYVRGKKGTMCKWRGPWERV